MRLFSDVCMVWRSVLTRLLVRANTAALLAEMYRYPIADESNGVFLMIFVHQNVCQMSGGREYSTRKKMVVIIRWQGTMLAFTIDHSSKQGIA
jgi:hypothetical protein